MKYWLAITGLALGLAACAGPRSTPALKDLTPPAGQAAAVPTLTLTAIQTALLAPTATLAPSPTPAIAPPDDRDLLAWTVAADGAVFVLDGTYTVYQLSPRDLSPLARSAPLFTATVPSVAYLAADETHLAIGSGAVSQTVVLKRDPANALSEVARLDQFGPMAVDPGKRLFMAPQAVTPVPFKGEFWVYDDLGDLAKPPQEVPLSCVAARDLTADPPARRLYVRLHTTCASPPHQAEAYAIYDLDTLQEPEYSKYELGILTRPALAGQAGSLVTTLYALNGADHTLFILDRQGQELKSVSPLDGIPAVDAAGDWIYLLRPHGLWVLNAGDLELKSVLPFTRTPPADLALAPDGGTLYLFGNGWRTALATAGLRNLGIAPVGPLPAVWASDDWMDYAQPRLYLAPGVDQAEAAFVQWVNSYGDAKETYRSTDGGRTWRLLRSMTYPVKDRARCLSLSPDFAVDRTLTAFSWVSTLRSTDGGDTWAAWQPPIAFTSDRDGNREIYTMDRQGGDVRRLTDDPAADETPAWSPAWTRLAFQSNRAGNWDIFTLRADCDPAAPDAAQRCDVRRLTDDPADDMLPAWSPDGRNIAFVSTRDGNPELYVMDSRGQNQRRLTFNPSGDWRPAWLPDSRHLVFTSDRAGNNDIYLMTVPSTATPLASEPGLTPLVTGPADDRDPAVSYDGQLLFLSDRDGVMKAFTLDMRDKASAPRAYTATDRPESHPAWLYDGGYTILVAAGQDRASAIYRAGYGAAVSDYRPLTTASAFNGHPAGEPVCWVSDESASLAWLKEREGQ
jgi:WD40 repeat protein